MKISGKDSSAFEQMKGLDGAARAVGLAVLAGKHQRRTMIALDNAGGANTDHAAMPVLSGDDERVGVFPLGRRVDLSVDFVEDLLLGQLAVAVELAQLRGHFGGASFIFFGKELDDALGHIHASGGVQAGRDAKCNVAGAERARAVELAAWPAERLQSGIARIAQALQAELGEDAIFSDQRDGVGDGRDGNNLQEGRQQSLAAGGLEQRLRDLESDPGSAERLAGILATCLIGIDHRNGLGDAFGLRQVMVGDDEIHAATLGSLGGGEGANAGVHADDEPDAARLRPAR